ncbi:uncharacterized protein J3R85_013276 [Psidium guajava]|nr:uncharacterized protein J3R85_013276 [Psidium guajava]
MRKHQNDRPPPHSKGAWPLLLRTSLQTKSKEQTTNLHGTTLSETRSHNTRD